MVEPRLWIVHQYAWRGAPHRQLYPVVLSLVRERWGCRAVVVDATGIGSGLAAFLGAALGPRIKRYAAGPQRLQRRLSISRALERHAASLPRKPRPELSPPGLVGRQRIAELREDPSWCEAWRTKRQAVTNRLTRKQLEEIAASKSKMSRKSTALRYGISATSVWRIWSGEIRLE